MGEEVDLEIENFSDAQIIGRGGFSTVYRAKDTQFDRDVAIKVLARSLSEADRRRFDRECRIMGRLSTHPNVATVYTAGYAPGDQPYLVMELVDGGSLADRIAARPLAWRDAVDLMVSVTNAVGAAHEAGILHRDIKPENILLAADGPRLTDFGIAYLRDATAATSTQITASWLHTPPETFDNQRDERSDVYSLGSTLYATIAGKAPFWRDEDESLNPLLRRLLTDVPPRLPGSLAPTELDDLIQRSLAKSPDDRPQTAAAFAAELTAIGGDGGQAGGPGSIGLAPVTVIRNRAEPAPDPSGAADATEADDPAVVAARGPNSKGAGADAESPPTEASEAADVDTAAHDGSDGTPIVGQGDAPADGADPDTSTADDKPVAASAGAGHEGDEPADAKAEDGEPAAGAKAGTDPDAQREPKAERSVGAGAGDKRQQRERSSSAAGSARPSPVRTVPAKANRRKRGGRLAAVIAAVGLVALGVLIAQLAGADDDGGRLTETEAADATTTTTAARESTTTAEATTTTTTTIPEPTVLNVVGQSRSGATADLEAEGIAVEIEWVNSDSVEEGFVVSQDPPAGAEADSVVLIVSAGPADQDDDGIADRSDNCPQVANPQQTDLDGDTLGDACDADRDGDGHNNDTDNCPDFANTNQIDDDGDGIGAACDNWNDPRPPAPSFVTRPSSASNPCLFEFAVEQPRADADYTWEINNSPYEGLVVLIDTSDGGFIDVVLTVTTEKGENSFFDQALGCARGVAG